MELCREVASSISDTNLTLPAPTGDWSNVSVLNAPGAEDYPVATLTYLLVYQNLSGAYGTYSLGRAENLANFLWWVVTAGQQFSTALDYAPLTSSIVSYDETAIQSMRFNSTEIPLCGPSVAPPTYEVTFTEAGLPSGTAWAVVLGGSVVGSSTTAISSLEPSGTISYSIPDVPGWHETTLAYSGHVVVNQSDLSEPTLDFVPETYGVTFSEIGLPSGATWSVAFRGTPVFSTSDSLTFTEPNGTYAFSVGSVGGYSANRSTASIAVSGLPVSWAVRFTPNSTGPATFLGVPANEGYALLAGIAAVAVIGAVIVAAVRRRRKSRPAPGSPSPGGPAAAPDAATGTGLVGEWDGTSG